MDRKQEFINLLLPHAVAAIGKQHGWLVRWALAKAGQECGWNPRNALLLEANNCLGVKGGVYNASTRKWDLFNGVPVVWKQDSLADGRNDGMVPWRVFPGLAGCFGEFVRMLNDRQPYDGWREDVLELFELIYADGTPGHVKGIAKNLRDVTGLLMGAGLVDAKGRVR
jgi:hypothetical protein